VRGLTGRGVGSAMGREGLALASEWEGFHIDWFDAVEWPYA
jgi:hypothetical protein